MASGRNSGRNLEDSISGIAEGTISTIKYVREGDGGEQRWSHIYSLVPYLFYYLPFPSFPFLQTSCNSLFTDWGIKIGNEGAKELAVALRKNKTVTWLSYVLLQNVFSLTLFSHFLYFCC